jgi:acyl carrier protein
MTQPELLDRARSMLAQRLNIDPATITPDSDIESLGADSLDLLVMAKEFEEHFRIQLATREIQKFRTVGDVVQALASKVPGAEPGLGGTQA